MNSRFQLIADVLACFVLIILLTTTAAAYDIDFNRDVRPILAETCFECHGPDEESREADLRLDQLHDAIGSVIVPGKPDKSELIRRLLSHDEDDVMPPFESKRRPTSRKIETLRRWIEEGAKFEQHWAFVVPQRLTIPEVSNASWVRNEIDAFVLTRLEQMSLKPNSDADPSVLARRLSLALTGLPILPERSDRFVAAYKADPDRTVSEYVDELLASDAYGEHFAWGWLDAARYADTNGYQGDGYRIMWPWRDWLVRSLNANVPFDQLTEQMLAGDLLLPENQRNWESADWLEDETSRELLVATGFLRNHRYDTGSGTIPAESKFENAADRMETVGTVWMGMTLLCARCHTHKYDPIENREYYELLSFFDNVPEVGSALKRASHPYIHVPTTEQQAELKLLVSAVRESETKLSAARDQITKSQAAWESKLSNTEVLSTRVIRGLQFQFAEEPIQFDGTSSIEHSNEPVLLCAGNKRWTISFWFRADSEKNGAIFSSVEEPQRYRPGIQADWVDGHLRVRHVCRWVNSYIEFRSKKNLAPGHWHHVTFRCDGRMQGLAYSASINGSDNGMICTHPVTNDSAEKAGKAPLILGGSPLISGFVGSLRDLRFYDRELNSVEVLSLADPRSTTELVRIPLHNRTEIESETLRRSFLESDDLPEGLRQLQNDYFIAVEKLEKAIRETPTTMVMQEAQTPRTRVRKAGVFDSIGNKVETGTPSFLPPLPEGERSRLALAQWLTHPDHPLTARVAVNRIWQTLWGRGFVDSPENFGMLCAEPIHADLLNWLATEYIRLGWDTKAIIKLIVTSRTYRQSSYTSNGPWKADPDNRHLARGPRFRLPVSAVRDQALFLSGRLDPTLGGPPVVLDEVLGKDGKPTNVPFEQSDNRRTLYTFWKRNSPHPMLAVFDVADRNQCEVRTLRTNTPLQALVTLNERGFAQSAEELGKRARAAADSDEDSVRWAWLACTGREPDESETDALRSSLHNYREHSTDEDQAWAALCNVLLNLDATLTLE